MIERHWQKKNKKKKLTYENKKRGDIFHLFVEGKEEQNTYGEGGRMKEENNVHH